MNLDKQDEQELWWLLQKIKDLLPYPFKEQRVEFHFKPSPGEVKKYNLDYIPEPEKQHELLDILKKENVLDYEDKLETVHLRGCDYVWSQFLLNVEKQSFDKLFQSYKQKYERQREVNYQKSTIAQLSFFPEDEIAEYKGVTKKVKKGKKAYELLDFMSKNKNTSFGADSIIQKCNDNIIIPQHKFKGVKDISDTIDSIRNSLKVKKSEYFPLKCESKRFIWREK